MSIIITISPGNSGGGAIHDFIVKNTDYKNPFKNQEFRIIQDPDGIENLYNNFYNNFSINNCSNAAMRFQEYIKSLSSLKINYDNNYKRVYNKNIVSLSNDYISKVTLLEYNAKPQFFAIHLNLINKIFLKFKKLSYKYFDTNITNFKMYLPKDKESFLNETNKFLLNLFNIQIGHCDKVILDQAVNIWNYRFINKIFDDAKIIIITRDPRSIFYSMKSRKSFAYPGDNIELFIRWYDNIMKRYISYKNKYRDENVLNIKFENFCIDYENNKNKILNFINSTEIKKNFNIDQTRYNAFKAQKLLKANELSLIEKNLKKYLQW